MTSLAPQTAIPFSIGQMTTEGPAGHLLAQLADDEAGQTAAYRIRYDGYLSYGHISDTSAGMFTDKYDHLANFMTAVITKDGTPAGTVRVGVCRQGRQDILPAMEIFPDEIAASLALAGAHGRATTAVEVGRLARSPAFGRDATILHAMFRTAGYLIIHHRADVVFSAVRLHHRPMYKRFGFVQISEPKPYPGLICDMVLMACVKADFGDAIENLPFLQGVDDQAAQSSRLIAGERITIPPPARAPCLRPAAHRQRMRAAPAWREAAPIALSPETRQLAAA